MRYYRCSYYSLLYINTINSFQRRFNVGEDCPVFDGLYEYCKIYTGGSLDGYKLRGSSWSLDYWRVEIQCLQTQFWHVWYCGELGWWLTSCKEGKSLRVWENHNAYNQLKDEASGFCYINDAVLAILEMLKCALRLLLHLTSIKQKKKKIPSKNIVHRYRHPSWRWRSRRILY